MIEIFAVIIITIIYWVTLCKKGKEILSSIFILWIIVLCVTYPILSMHTDVNKDLAINHTRFTYATIDSIITHSLQSNYSSDKNTQERQHRLDKLHQQRDEITDETLEYSKTKKYKSIIYEIIDKRRISKKLIESRKEIERLTKLLKQIK